jgi:hypothetical protein
MAEFCEESRVLVYRNALHPWCCGRLLPLDHRLPDGVYSADISSVKELGSMNVVDSDFVLLSIFNPKPMCDVDQISFPCKMHVLYIPMNIEEKIYFLSNNIRCERIFQTQL